MDFTVPEELRLLKQSIGEWVEQQVMPAENRIEEEDRIPEELLAQAAELGLFGLRIPEEYGGAGLGVLGQCLVYEELGRSSHGFCTVIGAHTGIGTTGIVEMGTEEQKRRFLPEMATGDRLAWPTRAGT